MGVLKTAMRIVGAVMVLMGLVWIGQGSGMFPYPATSFMIDQSPWIYYGLALSVVGLAVIISARRV